MLAVELFNPFLLIIFSMRQVGWLCDYEASKLNYFVNRPSGAGVIQTDQVLPRVTVHIFIARLTEIAREPIAPDRIDGSICIQGRANTRAVVTAPSDLRVFLPRCGVGPLVVGTDLNHRLNRSMVPYSLDLHTTLDSAAFDERNSGLP